MNRIFLSGRFSRNIDLKYTQNNIAVVTNALAVRKDVKNSDGGYDSDFINVIAYRNTAEYISKYFNKGDKVLISGRLNTRSYDNKDGKKIYVSEVIIETVESLVNKQAEVKEVKEEQQDPYSMFDEQMSLDNNDFLD